jgi:hypothetical protein
MPSGYRNAMIAAPWEQPDNLPASIRLTIINMNLNDRRREFG